MSDQNQFALVAVNAALIETALIESGGEFTPELEAELKNIARNTDQGASTIERCELGAEYYRKKAMAYTLIARGYERTESYIRQMIKDDMLANNVTELKGNEFRFKLSPAKGKLVIDEKNLDSAYIMHTPSPDKLKIEADLKVGCPVSGAHYEPSTALRIYLNKKAD